MALPQRDSSPVIPIEQAWDGFDLEKAKAVYRAWQHVRRPRETMPDLFDVYVEEFERRLGEFLHG